MKNLHVMRMVTLMAPLVWTGVALQARNQSDDRPLLSKRRFNRILALDLGDGDVEYETIILNHLAKAGGSFVRKILRHCLKNTSYLNIEHEKDSLSSNDVKDASRFVIGLVRNPYDYYVSLWGYTSYPNTCCYKSALTSEEREQDLGRDNPYGKTDEDKARFRKWLRDISADNLGVESLRFYGSYLRQPDHATPEGWHYLKSKAPEVQDHMSVIDEALRQFTPDSGPVTCWVHTENLVDDVRKCLEMYEGSNDHGVLGSVISDTRLVDWPRFEQIITDPRHVPASTPEDALGHVPCSEFYDQETLDLVERMDHTLLRSFGYPKGCSKK